MATRPWDNARDDHHGATMSDTHPIPDEHGTSHAVEGPHGSSADHGDDHGHDDHATAAMRSGRSTGRCGASASSG